MISRYSSRNLKNNFPKDKQKHNVGRTLYHETNTKKLEFFFVDNRPEYFYYSELDKLLKISLYN